MKKQKNDPFANLILDEEEKLLEEAFEKGEYEASPDFDETKKMLEEAASRHLELNTTKPVTIRLNQLDLIKLKARAKRKSIPYQTLLSALVNDYVQGKRELTL